ncbi:MAG TPA: response regulator transcription factor [Burkholderiales bacterium]|nr:response regulator transcription factor [Burkholderiales bacterium]
MKEPERSSEGIVLVVDDIPENLAFLHDALDEAGYTVLVATDGLSALHRAKLSRPDVILLDALMPQMSGFEVARRLKEDFATQHIPIIFMTGLTETEHVITAFASGGSDYVTKPIKPPEVLARIAAHMQSARHMRQARSALDAFGQATVALRENDGHLTWQTPLARKLLGEFFDPPEVGEARLVAWFSKARKAALEGREMPVVVVKGTKRLLAGLQDLSQAGHEGEWLIVLREESPSSVIESLVGAFHLTLREAEVLYWVICGKTNRDIGEILGSSHRTVNKHLEHVFEKLGVETRTAAAGLAMQKIRSPRTVDSSD